TGAVVNALNFPNVTSDEAPILKPYIKLAYFLGSFLGQVTQEGISSIKLELEGKASNIQDVPLMASALVGILEPTSAAVNNINSSSVAISRGINLSTIKHERRCDYETLLKISVVHEKGERTISGTLIAGNKPRIINIQGIPIESDFPKNALYLRNYDKPGFIGDLGNALGRQKINIASFHLGRRNVGGEAIALVEVDGGIDEKIVSEIKSLPQVARVNSICFE
ncbi:ACT domain-containing protein, partial [Alphaproteobacteria bacterium]|nr:ACT domain-containing protein [Alphaproteobacteria bacterium]